MAGLGRVILIANPVAQSGNGAKAAEKAAGILRSASQVESFEMTLTTHAKHAVDIAAASASFDTVIALGGDGVVHEVVNGLMTIDAAKRPALGVIPVGSGNDYAKTIKMSTKVDTAIEQILKCDAKLLDVGCCNGEYFAETLSFGLDAAIALSTMELRKKTGKSGTALYAQAGIDQLLHHLDSHAYRMVVEGYRPAGNSYAEPATKEFSGESVTFAVQIGRTYGGGFDICPQACADDGLFDICISHPPFSVGKAIAIFARAKSGKHVTSKVIEMFRATGMTLKFETKPPVQIDGEELIADEYRISIVPRCLNVLHG